MRAAILAILSLLPGLSGAQAVVETGRDADGLRFWAWRGEGIHFKVAQRLPDQTRAFFMARGFDRAGADLIASRCIFRSMFRNTADAGTVEIDLSRWRVLPHGGEPRHLLTREAWSRRWADTRVPMPARLALEWALLPTRQQYGPGDYNWGMLSFGLPAASRFDLRFIWRRDGKEHEARLENLECARESGNTR